jgi:hypothetical protein
MISNTIKNKPYIIPLDSIKKFNSDDIFHVNDVFFIEDLEQLFQEKGTPKLFLTDHCIYFENFIKGIDYLGVPLNLEAQRKVWSIDEFVNNTFETKYCFNFMINKKLIHRYMCIKLVEVIGLQNFTYTWSGIGKEEDCTIFIEDHNKLCNKSPLTSEQLGQILAPINLQPYFIRKDNEPDHIIVSIKNYGGNRTSWDWGIKNLFFDSAVSLITESLTTQKATMYSEKTLYSVLGLSFPIWVGGGCKQAEQWSRMGFDAFDDIINHDYQHYDTLLERCVYAFLLNQQILTDIDYARSLRLKNLSRLQNNRKLMLSGQVSSFIKKETADFITNESKNSFNDLLSADMNDLWGSAQPFKHIANI